MQKVHISKIPFNGNEGFQKDSIRIKGGELNIDINVFTGKQGDYYLCYSPSISLSGYGNSEKEAEEFIKIEMQVFCEDLMSMSTKERDNYLFSIGFKKERFKSKNFSKSYVDEDGMLKDFEQGTLEHKILTTA